MGPRLDIAADNSARWCDNPANPGLVIVKLRARMLVTSCSLRSVPTNCQSGASSPAFISVIFQSKLLNDSLSFPDSGLNALDVDVTQLSERIGSRESRYV